MIDYKLNSVSVGNGKATITVIIYEGGITTENEEDLTGKLVPVTRYRRTKKLGKKTATLDKEYTIEQLRDICNAVIKKISEWTLKTVIEQQKVTTTVDTKLIEAFK